MFSGSPLVIFGGSPAAKELELALAWYGEAGGQERNLGIAPETNPIAETLRLLQGSRIISDLESRLVPTSDQETNGELSRVERRLRQLSLEYRLASWQVSLVALVKRTADVKGQIPSTRVAPVGMPADMEFAAYFAPCDRLWLLRCPKKMMMRLGLADAQIAPESQSFEATRAGSRKIGAQAFRKLSRAEAFLEGVFGSKQGTAAAPQSEAGLLVCLSRLLEPDGGIPGKKHAMRIANSLAALLLFYEHGNTSTSGTFRMHVEKLLQFLTPECLKRLKAREESTALRTVELIRTGRPIASSWEQFVVMIVKGKRFDVSDFWTKAESALALVASATVAHDSSRAIECCRQIPALAEGAGAGDLC